MPEAVEQGLSAAEAAARRDRLGPNRLPSPTRPAAARRLFGELTHFFALMLWVAGGLALAAGLPALAGRDLCGDRAQRRLRLRPAGSGRPGRGPAPGDAAQQGVGLAGRAPTDHRCRGRGRRRRPAPRERRPGSGRRRRRPRQTRRWSTPRCSRVRARPVASRQATGCSPGPSWSRARPARSSRDRRRTTPGWRGSPADDASDAPGPPRSPAGSVASCV